MIRLFVTWLVSLMVLSCSLPALAVEGGEELPAETSPEVVSVETQEGDKSIVVNVTLPAASTPEPTPESVEIPEITLVNDDPVYIPYSATALDEAPAPNTALVDAVKELFGDYQPRTQTVTEHLTDGTTVIYQQVVPGLAGLDWPWLVGVGLFALFLYGLLRLLGGLIKL